ncbi:MAG TPA: sulfurtransferase TusA family protein, partial [Methylomirabilota bacterium]|nr:sulfurtransferase TusA family protein [Methylomirabilota bacterium]
MDETGAPSYRPDISFDGGDLDCGSGLLLLIRKHIDPLARGQILEVRSTEISVEQDLPSWCRLTGNDLISWNRNGGTWSFLICKGSLSEKTDSLVSGAPRSGIEQRTPETRIFAPLSNANSIPHIAPLSVMGIGSWPRPRWMLQAMHEHIEGRLGEEEFQSTADDAVRLAVEAQLRSGVDVVTDGEQRRDNYASFVGGLLENCQLIPLTDLLPLVDDPEEFEKELQSLDVPASEVRHPAVFGKLKRGKPIASHELAFVRTLTDKPVKIALPGPYLLTRIMWMECISDKAYATREELAADIVQILREELHELLSGGAALIQLDEPVLTEVVFTGAKNSRSFMCGALSEKGSPEHELAFARELINQLVDGVPLERTAIHICRGNWTRDESAALRGDYRPLMPILKDLKVGNYLLELCTPRAGEIEALKELPQDRRIGVGLVNQKTDTVESVEEIVAKAKKAMDLFDDFFHRL